MSKWLTLCMPQVSFDRDVIISQNNEYEILQLMMSDCRERLSQYPGKLGNHGISAK